MHCLQVCQAAWFGVYGFPPSSWCLKMYVAKIKRGVVCIEHRQPPGSQLGTKACPVSRARCFASLGEHSTHYSLAVAARPCALTLLFLPHRRISACVRAPSIASVHVFYFPLAFMFFSSQGMVIAAWIAKYIGLHGQPEPAADNAIGRIIIPKLMLKDRHTIYKCVSRIYSFAAPDVRRAFRQIVFEVWWQCVTHLRCARDYSLALSKERAHEQRREDT